MKHPARWLMGLALAVLAGMASSRESDAAILFEEGFEGAWTGPWSMSNCCSPYQWGRDTYQPHDGTRSAFPYVNGTATTNTGGAGVPWSNYYTAMYFFVDIPEASGARLTFWYNPRMQSDAFFQVYVYPGGGPFVNGPSGRSSGGGGPSNLVFSSNANQPGWKQAVIDLSSRVGEDGVEIEFYYFNNYGGEIGVWVDDILLETCECTGSLCCDGCHYEPEGADCDDRQYCTDNDVCNANHECTGPPRDCSPKAACNEAQNKCVDCVTDVDCDDGNTCTIDACNVVAGSTCTHSNATAGCNDGLFCNGQDACADGQCTVHGGSPCDPLQCDEETDGCFPGCTGDISCADSDLCNGIETCNVQTGICLPGNPLVCNDGDLCNGEETCDPDLGCVAGTPLDCSDNDRCNGLETCSRTTGCVVGNPLICNDNSVCNGVESCDPLQGCLAGTPLVCDDGDVCNGRESCSPANGCQAGVPLDCSDEDVCTGIESCDPVDGCLDEEPLDCDDGDVCTDDNCDAVDGCFSQAREVRCGDGLVCGGELCENTSPGVGGTDEGCTEAQPYCIECDTCTDVPDVVDDDDDDDTSGNDDDDTSGDDDDDDGGDDNGCPLFGGPLTDDGPWIPPSRAIDMAILTLAMLALLRFRRGSGWTGASAEA